MKYKCIIFDCDGVLVDSEAISTPVLINMAQEVGANINAEYVEQHFSGKSLKSTFQALEKQIGRKLPDSFEQTYRQRTYDAFKTSIQPVKGIRNVLEKLTVPFCVASSGPVEKIELNLTTTKLLPYFEGRIFSAYEIGTWKPDPGIFLHAAAQMGFQPHECAVVEDSLAGVQAGIKGGFDVFAYGKPNNRTMLEKEGANVFFAMEDLIEIFEL